MLMYYIESPAQPDAFGTAFSSLWWTIATITTVGYGDIYPITVMGQILGIFISLLGIALIAIPTGIITAGFIEQNVNNKNSTQGTANFCPNCGHCLQQNSARQIHDHRK
jgi:voltage-gated potassium channel